MPSVCFRLPPLLEGNGPHSCFPRSVLSHLTFQVLTERALTAHRHMGIHDLSTFLDLLAPTPPGFLQPHSPIDQLDLAGYVLFIRVLIIVRAKLGKCSRGRLAKAVSMRTTLILIALTVSPFPMANPVVVCTIASGPWNRRRRRIRKGSACRRQCAISWVRTSGRRSYPLSWTVREGFLRTCSHLTSLLSKTDELPGYHPLWGQTKEQGMTYTPCSGLL